MNMTIKVKIDFVVEIIYELVGCQLYFLHEKSSH